MRQENVRTPSLDVAYFEGGSPKGSPVLLLHGFPDDATCWSGVIQALDGDNLRLIAPFVRGCGKTRFISGDTPRAGDFAALGQDAVDVIDALDLHDLTLVGQDWGSPTAEIVAIERPERVKRLIKLNWYGVYSMAEMAQAQRFEYAQLRALWYVWLFNTPMGEMVLDHDRAGLARALWAEWSPSWAASERDEQLDAVLDSFDGDDWKRVALAAYRADISPDAERDPSHDALRERLRNPPPVRCETVILNGADDGVEKTPLSSDALARYFLSGARVQTLRGVGHFPQREAPEAVAHAIAGQSITAA